MAKLLPEMLKELNENPKLAETTYKDNSQLKIVFDYAYSRDKVFQLPKGNPPYTENPKPVGLCETHILFELRRFGVFIRKDLPPLKIESLFISLLEALHPDEAEILLSIKDQKLDRIYKKLTQSFVIKHGYIVDDRLTKEEKAAAKEAKAAAKEVEA